jgi:hypothetical protein
MTMVIFVVVVLAQIILFQVISALANRSILMEEVSQLTGPVPESVTRHSRIAPMVRIGIGGALASVALVALFGLEESQNTARILIAGASAVSAVAFGIAQATDRQVMRDLSDAAPGGGVRHASLDRRTHDKWYHPVLEVIPIVIFVSTAIFLLSTTGLSIRSEVLSDRPRILVYFGLQGMLVIAGLYRALRPVIGISSISQFIPSLRRNPEASIRLGEELAGTQLRFFLIAKICLSSLLGVQIVKNVLWATGSAAAATWSALGWCILAVLAIAYGYYLRRIGKISRRMQEQMGSASP